MHDIRLEDLLRQTLRTEADSLVLTLTTDVLQQRLAGRRRQARSNRGWLLVAAVAAVTLAGVAAALVGSQSPPPVVPPTPSPSPSPALVLPEPAALLADFPDATVKLERSGGPADQPIEPDATTVPGALPAPIEVGRITFAGPFVIAMACLGEGEMVAAITSPSIGVPYTQAVAPCDGKPIVSEYLSPPIDPASDGDVVTVTVRAGNPWRLAVGERPAAVIAQPEFAPIAITTGWNKVSGVPPYLLSDAVPEGPKTGAHMTMPDKATRAGVFVQCVGSGTIAITTKDSSPTDVACDPSGTSSRIEFPAVGGERWRSLRRATGAACGSPSRSRRMPRSRPSTHRLRRCQRPWPRSRTSRLTRMWSPSARSGPAARGSCRSRELGPGSRPAICYPSPFPTRPPGPDSTSCPWPAGP